MARDKNNASNGSAKQETMMDKTQPEMGSDDNLLANIIGLALVVVGVFVIALVVVVLVFSKREPAVNEDLSVPTLDKAAEYTDEKTITISGSVEDADNIAYYVNEEYQGKTVKVKDGDFEFEYEVEEDGEYVFEAVSVKGFPIRKRSEKSNAVTVNVDTTAPSSDVDVEYDKETDKNNVTVSGQVKEEDLTVRLKKGSKSYKTVSDKDGKFEVKEVPLEEGENSFTVEIEDNAGNVTVLSKKVNIKYAVGDLNGDGVTDENGNDNGDLPESAGELDAAMEFLFENKLMATFGLLALVVLVANGSMVAMKLKKQ